MHAQTKDEQGYNGWTNYETWAVNLWIDNELPLQDYAQDLARQSRREARGHVNVQQGIWEPDRAAVYLLSQSLRDWVRDELLPDLGATLAADLLMKAEGEVDYYKIAEHYLADLEPEPDDADDDAV
jgi:hypothetical protein